MRRVSGRSLFHFFFVSLSLVSFIDAAEFDFGSLTLSSLKLLGDAHLKNSKIRLSRDLPVPNSGAGRALYTEPIKFLRANSAVSFSTFFSFSIENLNPSSVGGGLAFIITSDDQLLGDPGGYLGLVNSTDPAGFTVAVEFDTVMDPQFMDINGNHAGFDLNSLISAHFADLGSINVNLRSGRSINAWIEYDGMRRAFKLWISYSKIRPPVPLLSFDLDLARYLFDEMFVGFSGSTQGSTEIHSIDSWSFLSGDTEAPPVPPSPSNARATMASPPSPAPFIPPPASRHSRCHNQLCKKDPAAVAGAVTAGAFVLAVLMVALIWVFSRRLKYTQGSDALTSEMVASPREFRYKELKSATRGFDPTRIIGHGAFGIVYKGIIPDTGAMVAVKRCSHGGAQGRAEFLSELSIIGTLRHKNLVRLQGWCHEKGEILLVYDLMPNGSLDKALFEARTPLSWALRLNILVGVASALAYLHRDCDNQVIHRDIKASNVMLDEFYNARLGDFGLARQVEHNKSPQATLAAGTMGYLAPEYLLTGKATEKTDVFSFGALVLEVACGRRPIEKDVGPSTAKKGWNLVEWVWGMYRDGRLLEAVDGRLGGEFEEGEITRVLLVGLICSHPDPVQRPNMRSVVQLLGGEAPLPHVPVSKPCLSFDTSSLLLSLQDSVSDCNALIVMSTTSSSGSLHALSEMG